MPQAECRSSQANPDGDAGPAAPNDAGDASREEQMQALGQDYHQWRAQHDKKKSREVQKPGKGDSDRHDPSPAGTAKDRDEETGRTSGDEAKPEPK